MFPQKRSFPLNYTTDFAGDDFIKSPVQCLTPALNRKPRRAERTPGSLIAPRTVQGRPSASGEYLLTTVALNGMMANEKTT